MRLRFKGLFLGLAQYFFTQIYIFIYIAIDLSLHLEETVIIPFNFLVLSAIIAFSTYIGVKKFNVGSKDIWFVLIFLFVAFTVYQYAWLYFFVFCVRNGSIWDDFNIISLIEAFFTAVEYSLISLVTVELTSGDAENEADDYYEDEHYDYDENEQDFDDY